MRVRDGKESYDCYKEPKSRKVGKAVARKCEHCGHHEIGIEDDAGQYYPLREGMKVEIIEDVQS